MTKIHFEVFNDQNAADARAAVLTGLKFTVTQNQGDLAWISVSGFGAPMDTQDPVAHANGTPVFVVQATK